MHWAVSAATSRFDAQNQSAGRTRTFATSPAHSLGSPAAAGILPGGITTYTYRLAVPRDTTLNFCIASHDLKLGDATGVALPANASQQAFQHATGDPNPKSFSFSVLGLLP